MRKQKPAYLDRIEQEKRRDHRRKDDKVRNRHKDRDPEHRKREKKHRLGRSGDSDEPESYEIELRESFAKMDNNVSQDG